VTGDLAAVAALARWLELAEAEDVAGSITAAQARGEPGLTVEAIGGARAVDAGPDSHVNRVYGFGFDGGDDAAGVLDAIDAFFDRAGRPARIELSPYAHPAFLPLLRARRYGVEGFRDVLVRPLGRGADAAVDRPEVQIERVDVADDDALLAAMQVVGRGFADGAEPMPKDIAVGLRVARQPGAMLFQARIDGAAAGGGTVVVSRDRAVLLGASTLPEYRRRGVQRALMLARLADAVERGAKLATIQAAPGVSTRTNAERLGFRLAYGRVTLLRDL
jgi:ribosomal protein S18 acetylase RimI-like enzyme